MQSLLYYYCHPSEEPSPSHDALITKVLDKHERGQGLTTYETTELTYHKTRIEDWQASFCSVYGLLRNGKIDYFYYVAKHFSALFVSAKMSESTYMEVIISAASKSFRMLLKKEGE